MDINDLKDCSFFDVKNDLECSSSDDSEGFCKKNKVDLGTVDVENTKKLSDEELRQSFDEIAITPEKVLSSILNPKLGAKDFELRQVLGKGGYGKVFLVKKITEPNNGIHYAMKVMSKASILRRKKDVDHTLSERNILELVKHPFLVKLEYAFQTNNKLYLVLEYLSGGELFMLLDKKKYINENSAVIYLAEIVLALDHLHNLGIVYRDLKPENIMFDGEGHIKLTDFGLCKKNVDDEENITQTFCGTVEYMAPEVILKIGHGTAADWWSLGAVMYDMLSGGPPFVANTKAKTIEKVLNSELNLPPYMTSAAKDLIRQLLQRDPKKRLGYGKFGGQRVKDHKWFRKINWHNAFLRQLKPKESVVTSSKRPGFHPKFQGLPVVDTPVENSLSMQNDMFQGFSYTRPEKKSFSTKEKSYEDESNDLSIASKTCKLN